MTPFIWQYKAVKINKKHLCKTENEVGFGLPNLRYNYLAAHLNSRVQQE